MSEGNPNNSKKSSAILMASNSNLKALVSEKLLHLLGDFNYNLDCIRVLTEYVVVLVSNGKCQSEAKAELEPFLGDSTTEFVSWLWDILSEASNDSNAHMSSSDLKNITGASSTEVDDASSKIQSKKCGSGVRNSYCQFPVFSNTLVGESNNKNASAFSCKSNENCRYFENNRDGSLNDCSFKTKPSAEQLHADRQYVQYEKVHEKNMPFKHSQVTNVGRRRLLSKAADAVFLQNGINETTRGSVWDRLGMLTENDASLKVKKINANEGNLQRQKLEQNSPGVGQNLSMTTVQGNKVKQSLSQNCSVKTYRSNDGQKKQLNDFVPISGSNPDSLDHEQENSRKFRRQSEKHSYMLKGSGASCESEKSEIHSKCCISGFDASFSSRTEKISQEKLSVEALESTQTLNSHSALPAATGGTGPVQAQLVDMKLRLQQLETEISKLRSKPVNKDGEHTLSFSFGPVDLLEKGVESRTVFVTNVATQDALRSYFATCGAITRVTKLTDASPIKKKWSAYITFTTKESVDKALALNGTSFFSRIIWVRKAGKVAGKPTCTPHAGERSYLPAKTQSQPSSTLAKEPSK